MQSFTQAKRIARQRDQCCICCGNKGRLTAHHIYCKAKYPKLRTNENNLATLCIKCHRRYHDDFCNGSANKVNLTNFIKYLTKYNASKIEMRKIMERLEGVIQNESQNY